MTELWLNFKNENGLLKRIPVEGQQFTVGRTSDNDLSVPLPELSRRHIQIQRSGNKFIVSDVGSSNGTTLDGIELVEPTALENGQTLNLGGGLDVRIELVVNNAAADVPASVPAYAMPEASSEYSGDASAPSASVSSAKSSSSSDGGSIPLGFFILAPILGFLVIGIVVFIIFVSNGSSDPNVAQRDDNIIYTSRTPTDEEEEDELDTPTPKPTAASSSSNNSSPNGAGTTSSPEPVDIPATPKPSSDTDKIERASVSFLRHIAANSSNEFLTVKQIGIVSPKINQFKSSNALAENLKNAKRNAAQIEEIARSKSLRPQFVATAALAQLGNQQGDVAKTAQGMSEVLARLYTTFGNDLADDNLLMIAYYDQGVADRTIATRDMVAAMVSKFSDKNPREIRTIWFLRENGKISDTQFDFALKFLAIGIIMQNPKDFNVQSEAVIFN